MAAHEQRSLLTPFATTAIDLRSNRPSEIYDSERQRPSFCDRGLCRRILQSRMGTLPAEIEAIWREVDVEAAKMLVLAVDRRPWRVVSSIC